MSDLRGEVIRNLVDHRVAERKDLDYKEKLPGGTDSDKREFLADVVSLANTGGGHIVYGVAERRDSDGHATGEPERVQGLKDNLDQAQLRLDQIIRSGVSPRVAGITWRVVDDLGADGPVLVLHVPRSYQAPHMMSYGGASRFYARS